MGVKSKLCASGVRKSSRGKGIRSLGPKVHGKVDLELALEPIPLLREIMGCL